MKAKGSPRGPSPAPRRTPSGGGRRRRPGAGAAAPRRPGRPGRSPPGWPGTGPLPNGTRNRDERTGHGLGSLPFSRADARERFSTRPARRVPRRKASGLRPPRRARAGALDARGGHGFRSGPVASRSAASRRRLAKEIRTRTGALLDRGVEAPAGLVVPGQGALHAGRRRSTASMSRDSGRMWEERVEQRVADLLHQVGRARVAHERRAGVAAHHGAREGGRDEHRPPPALGEVEALVVEPNRTSGGVSRMAFRTAALSGLAPACARREPAGQAHLVLEEVAHPPGIGVGRDDAEARRGEEVLRPPSATGPTGASASCASRAR